MVTRLTGRGFFASNAYSERTRRRSPGWIGARRRVSQFSFSDTSSARKRLYPSSLGAFVKMNSTF
jgi:hypothetical protein